MVALQHNFPLSPTCPLGPIDRGYRNLFLEQAVLVRIQAGAP